MFALIQNVRGQWPSVFFFLALVVPLLVIALQFLTSALRLARSPNEAALAKAAPAEKAETVPSASADHEDV